MIDITPTLLTAPPEPVVEMLLLNRQLAMDTTPALLMAVPPEGVFPLIKFRFVNAAVPPEATVKSGRVPPPLMVTEPLEGPLIERLLVMVVNGLMIVIVPVTAKTIWASGMELALKMVAAKEPGPAALSVVTV